MFFDEISIDIKSWVMYRISVLRHNQVKELKKIIFL